MYKNFNLTEEERKQIMEMHKSHGYKAPINEIERYVPGIDSPEEEDEINAELGYDTEYDPYKEDPFKSIENDDFYDEKIGGLRAKEAPRKKNVDTSVIYRGPHADGRMNKFGIREFELDQKIARYQDMIQTVEKELEPLVDEYEKKLADGTNRHWISTYKIEELQDRIIKMQNRLESFIDMKNNFQPLRPTKYNKRGDS
jgi:hypothetical protein